MKSIDGFINSTLVPYRGICTNLLYYSTDLYNKFMEFLKDGGYHPLYPVEITMLGMDYAEATAVYRNREDKYSVVERLHLLGLFKEWLDEQG